ncbi:Hypothetical predicted protein [Mytilus galloprovincialis]|uniref:Uncharacterized protein n=1 Tax=Mytilus galloprovincialis TaxID=29158 RepID=A0A8B6C2V8_MYTGA|nr:Hypothetical predicted protein [Mytilus galloprovincialis]
MWRIDTGVVKIAGKKAVDENGKKYPKVNPSKRSSSLWKENDKLQRWFEKTWLKCYKSSTGTIHTRLDVESFPLDSAEDTSGFDDDNISEVHISSIEDTVPLEVTEEGIDIYFEEQGEGCAHRPPQDDQQDAPGEDQGEGCAHRPPQDDQQDAPGESCAHRPSQEDQQDAPGEDCAHRPPQEDK